MGGIPQAEEKESIMGQSLGRHLLALPCLRPLKELEEQVFLPDELLAEMLGPGSRRGGGLWPRLITQQLCFLAAFS